MKRNPSPYLAWVFFQIFHEKKPVQIGLRVSDFTIFPFPVEKKSNLSHLFLSLYHFKKM